MKKYLISGFNTVQDVRLEAGTYTLVAYAKSMYGNVYTFALGDDVNWTEYDIDVIQGQLCKVWLTFTIDKKVTKFKPISNNFSESLPVYVTDLQLTRGNIPVEAGASPFDIDKILNDLHDEIDAIEDFTEGAFLDGLLTDVEKTQLRVSLDTIGSIVESVKGSYNKLLDNPFISNNTMNNITAKYNDFIASWISDVDPRGLKTVILWIVNGDNIISQDERDEKDRALNAFNDALYAYNQAEKEIYNDIGTSIDKAQSDANISLAKTEGFTKIGDVNFPEGLIFTSLIKLLDAGNDGEEMAGISGIAGANKEDPAFWAGGTYNQAFDGTAKTIIRHDGSGQLAGGNIEWDDVGNVELSGKIASGGGISTIDDKIKLNSDGSGQLADGNIRWSSQGGAVFTGGIVSPFVPVDIALVGPNSDNLPCNIYSFKRGQTTSIAYYYTLPCDKELSGLVVRIHNIQGGRSSSLTIDAPQSDAFYEDGTVKSNLDLKFGEAIELICVADDVGFHSWDVIRRYKCRPYVNP